MKKNIDKIISYILIGCLFVFYYVLVEYRNAHKDIETNKLLSTVVFNSNIDFSLHLESDFDYYDENELIELKDKYHSSAIVNFDVVGFIDFPSGLFRRTIVQGIDNYEYLNKDWTTTSYSEYGSVFMDADDSIDSCCIRIYGNDSIYSLGELMVLSNEEVLKDNRILSFILEDEIRYYEIVRVDDFDAYEFDSNGDNELIIVITNEIVIVAKEIGRETI